MALKSAWILMLSLATSYTAADVEVVHLRDVTTDRGTRNLDGGLPESLEFELKRDGKTTSLRLNENKRLNENAPMFEGRQGPDGEPEIRRIRDAPLTNAKYYQDKRNGGAFHVLCKPAHHGPCVREMHGNLVLRGINYDLSPVAMATRDLDNPDSDIIPYHLTMSDAELKDGVYRVLEIPRQEEPFVDYKEHPAKRNQPPLDKLQRRLEQLLNAIKNNRIKRQAPLYALEVLVTIDPALWKKYFDRTTPSPTQSRDEATELLLRERFSHVINGMSLRYESIEDPEMNIYITLSGFLIFKSLLVWFPNFADFKAKVWQGLTMASSPVIDDTNPLGPNINIPVVDGRELANSDVYLDRMVGWARNLTTIPENDHIMLFTGYDLFFGNLNRGVVGVAFLNGVCTRWKVSLNEDRSYFQTMSVATHELGHNLGSRHDGTNACPASASFLMAPSLARFFPGTSFSINPWRFSNCSIQAFKTYVNSLRSNCLLDDGNVFNNTEYKEHVSMLPGERHSPDEQCKMIRGEVSSLCSNERDVNICRLMLCSGGDGFCYYYAAAVGTPCGQPETNRWCFEGQCVARNEGNTSPTSIPPTSSSTSSPTSSTFNPSSSTFSPTDTSSSISSTSFTSQTPTTSIFSTTSSSTFNPTSSFSTTSSTFNPTSSFSTTSSSTFNPTSSFSTTSSSTFNPTETTSSFSTSSTETSIFSTSSTTPTSTFSTTSSTLSPTSTFSTTSSTTPTSTFSTTSTETSTFSTTSSTSTYNTTQTTDMPSTTHRPYTSTAKPKTQRPWWWWWWHGNDITTTTTAPPCVDLGFYGYSCGRILKLYRGRKYLMCGSFEDECCFTCTS